MQKLSIHLVTQEKKTHEPINNFEDFPITTLQTKLVPPFLN